MIVKYNLLQPRIVLQPIRGLQEKSLVFKMLLNTLEMGKSSLFTSFEVDSKLIPFHFKGKYLPRYNYIVFFEKKLKKKLKQLIFFTKEKKEEKN